MLYEKFHDKENNPFDKQNIYNVEGYKTSRGCRQPVTTGSVLKILFFFSPIP